MSGRESVYICFDESLADFFNLGSLSAPEPEYPGSMKLRKGTITCCNSQSPTSPSKSVQLALKV